MSAQSKDAAVAYAEEIFSTFEVVAAMVARAGLKKVDNIQASRKALASYFEVMYLQGRKDLATELAEKLA